MKLTAVIFVSLISIFAEANDCNPTWYGCDSNQPRNESTILLSCSGITADNKAAIQLIVTKSREKGLRAKIQSTTRESETILLNDEGGGILRPVDQSKVFSISIGSGQNHDRAMVMWQARVLDQQFNYILMSCAVGTNIKGKL